MQLRDVCCVAIIMCWSCVCMAVEVQPSREQRHIWLVDCFTQQWFNDVHNSSPLSLYKHIKCSLHYEQYLNCVASKPLRLGIPAHNLRIEVGRYGVNRIQRCDRVCQLCETSDIEDEYHFVCCCPALINERKLYLNMNTQNQACSYLLTFCVILVI
jgi:hypothetical protein